VKKLVAGHSVRAATFAKAYPDVAAEYFNMKYRDCQTASDVLRLKMLQMTTTISPTCPLIPYIPNPYRRIRVSVFLWRLFHRFWEPILVQA